MNTWWCTTSLNTIHGLQNLFLTKLCRRCRSIHRFSWWHWWYIRIANNLIINLSFLFFIIWFLNFNFDVSKWRLFLFSIIHNFIFIIKSIWIDRWISSNYLNAFSWRTLDLLNRRTSHWNLWTTLHWFTWSTLNRLTWRRFSSWRFQWPSSWCIWTLTRNSLSLVISF